MASTSSRPAWTRRSSWWSPWPPATWSSRSSPSGWRPGRALALEQLPRSEEHAGGHGLGEAAGVRVLLADVVGAEQDPVVGERSLGGVGEAGLGADRAEVAEGLVPGEGAEGDDHVDVEQGELGGQPGGAVVALGGERLVVGRGALDRGGDVAAGEGEAVAAGDRGRLVGEAGAVEAGEQPVAGAVAGEDPAGAVAAVGGRGQAQHEQAGRRVAEAGDGAPPVLLVAEGGPLLLGHLLAPGDQPGAAEALRHLGGQPVEALAGGAGTRGCGARHAGTVASGSWAGESRPTWPRCCGRGWPPPAWSPHPGTRATSNATWPSTSSGSPPWPQPPTSAPTTHPAPTPPRRPGRGSRSSQGAAGAGRADGSGRGVWTTGGPPGPGRLPSRVGAPRPALGLKCGPRSGPRRGPKRGWRR